MPQLTFRVSEEVKEEFNKTLKTVNGSTANEKIAELLRQVANMEKSAEEKQAERQKHIDFLNDEINEYKQVVEDFEEELSDPIYDNELVLQLQVELRNSTDAVNVLQLKYDRVLELVRQLTNENERLKDIIRNSSKQSDYEPDKMTLQLLQITVEKLKKKYPRVYPELQPQHLLRHAFLAYTIQRHAEIFWDFVVTDQEILHAAQLMNPDLKTIAQVCRFLF